MAQQWRDIARHGIDYEVFEAVAQSANEAKGE
jgi:hypothetical protein